ncbi:MAG TPA: tripartite tricarboxylate transporter substrate binding protein [Casimicrobiaceae bacterium]|nr:tripartite tricarboxylate transporter substrate binding protein [Casimicrobiaceae bacterium]
MAQRAIRNCAMAHDFLHEMSPRMSLCTRREFLVSLAGGALALALPTSAWGQGSYPSRPVTIVVPFTPGTGADVLARLLEPHLSARLKQAFVVENRAGASGAIGMEAVAKAKPDGYTLLFSATSHGTIPALRAKLPFDALKSYAPVALLATSALALVVSPEVPAKTVRELVALAQSKPGELYYSSPGNGSVQHLTMELFKLETGTNLVHVPYKGSAGAATDLIGGHVQATVAALQTMAPFVKSGKLRMVAVLSEQRSPAFPDVPTAKEAGLPSMVVDTWYGALAPAGTPGEIVKVLNSEINAALQLPEVREAMAQQGMTPVIAPPERMGKLLEAELARWKRVVSAANIQGE